MSSQVEQIKARLSIVEVVGSYIKLEKAGGNFKARCPFHNEKSASFFVSPSRDSYHCFGCNRGGDIFSFVQEIEGLDFLGSLEVLAARAGVELKPVDPKLKSENERLYGILEAATRFFSAQLAANPEAQAYVAQRGITDETVKNFRLGYAPADWQALLNHLLKLGYQGADIEKAGLAIKTTNSVAHPNGRYYDRFRGRVMFPISDVSGRVIGFSGRIFVIDPNREEAKYINTPQTPVYDKSSALFGYDKAKVEIKKKGFCVLVEGQMDLVLSHQAGITNTVAVSGTALTDRHLNLVKRLADNLVMAFDGDSAGIKASRRAVDMALALGLDVRIALLPDGLDPADLVLRDKEEWIAAIDQAKNVIDFQIDILARQKYDDRQRARHVTEDILPYVARLGNSIDQAHFVSKLALFLGVKEEPVWDELKKVSARLEPIANKYDDFTSSLARTSGEQAAPKRSRADVIADKIFGLLFWQRTLTTPSLELAAFEAEVKTILGDENFLIKHSEREKNKEGLLLEAELTFSGNERLKSEADELLLNLQEENLRQELSDLLPKIKAAELAGETEKLAEYLKRCQAISLEINQLKNINH